MFQNSANTVSYLPLFQTLLGGLLTFLGGLLGNFWIQKMQRKSEQESLASAFAGEVNALLAMLEKRQLAQLLTELLADVKKTGKRTYNYLDNSSDKFEVYENNVGKIGLLPVPLPEKIVLFYALALAMINDMKFLGQLKSEEYNSSTFENYIESLIELIKQTINAGRDVQSLLKSKVLKDTT